MRKIITELQNGLGWKSHLTPTGQGHLPLVQPARPGLEGVLLTAKKEKVKFISAEALSYSMWWYFYSLMPAKAIP